ncbi:hypothetical protein KIH74_04440 [Kineosporia sp. J2-2]|uniref:GH26 domain-containing protein n=1 Tax=Kineosporia corallincola TaxID=2835133 RepID=A0ABS5TAR0_9ACTN|nr:glycosyl hydrolase [Kineosporia corallincola]MBT0768157.1 hypothetical protein [Kineosporia corallincola]
MTGPVPTAARGSSFPRIGLAVALLLITGLVAGLVAHRGNSSRAEARPAASPDEVSSFTALDGRLGVFSANTLKGALRYEKWLGREVSFVTVFADRSNWKDIERPQSHVPDLGRFKAHGKRAVFSLPMLPDSLSARKDTAMKAGGTGRFNDHFVRLGKNLVALDQADAVIRMGWEFQLDSWAWGGGDAESYRQYFRQIVTAMRQVPGQEFEFDWNPNNGYNERDGVEYWPGDQYVDYVGVDAYDVSFTFYPYPQVCDQSCRLERQKRTWDENVYGGPRGLQFWAQFARSHQKKMSLPEWATWDRFGDDDGGGKDDPYYIQKMYEFITYAPNNVGYANFFDTDSDQGLHNLDRHFPDAAQEFTRLFGDAAVPSANPG